MGLLGKYGGAGTTSRVYAIAKARAQEANRGGCGAVPISQEDIDRVFMGSQLRAEIGGSDQLKQEMNAEQLCAISA